MEIPMLIPDICHTHHNRWLWRKNLSCGENFPYDRLSCGEVSPHEKCEENLSHRESSPHDKCGAKCVMWRNVEKSVMWRNFPQDRFLHMRNEKCQANLLCGGISPHDISLLQIMLFCCKICFVAIYAVLLRKLFCRDLRAFCVEKNWTKNCVCGEKKTNIRYVQRHSIFRPSCVLCHHEWLVCAMCMMYLLTRL